MNLPNQSLATLGGQATPASQTGGDRQAFLSSEAAGRSQEAHVAPVHVSHILNQVVCDLEKRCLREVAA